jgi:hypothetical protein
MLIIRPQNLYRYEMKDTFETNATVCGWICRRRAYPGSSPASSSGGFDWHAHGDILHPMIPRSMGVAMNDVTTEPEDDDNKKLSYNGR